jgi:hypothetical protein
MFGTINTLDTQIYEITDFNKLHTDKSRQGFRDYLEEKLGIIFTQQTVNRWVSSVELNHHLPAYALAAFVNYYKDQDNKHPDAMPSVLPLITTAFEAGYMIYPIDCPDIKEDIQSFFNAVTKNQKESSEAISAAAAAMADGELSKKELKVIEKELLEQVGAVAVLLRMVGEALE